MTTITLPPDLEERLAAEARRRGTTAELLALDSLRQLFVPNGADDRAVAGESLFDSLSGYIGAVDGTSEALSEDCGRRLSEGLEERQRQGRL
jgi:hypothetical protein